MFALVIIYLDETWTPRHATVGLFEVHKTTSTIVALQLQTLLEKNGLIHHVIAFVKDKGDKLGTMVVELKFIVYCEPLKLLRFIRALILGM
jgi:hypothetical protein